VRVYDAGHDANTCYLVSEFVTGQTLAERVKAGRPSWRKAVQWMIPIAEAIHYAHQHGIIHRDLKPGNIVIDADEQPRVLDFGLALCLDADSPHEGNAKPAGEAARGGQPRGASEDAAPGLPRTAASLLLGTPAYMAPEQSLGAHAVDGRADVYSLGVILYELLTGRPPFLGSPPAILHQVVNEPPPPLRSIDPAVPRDLETICLKALAKNAERRYATAADLAQDLGRWLRGEPIRARAVGRAERLASWGRRNPLAVALVGATLTALAAVTGLWLQARKSAAIAEENYKNALELISTVNQELLKGEFSSSSMQPDRRAVFRLALEHYRQFVLDMPREGRFRVRLGLYSSKMGLIEFAIGRPDIARAEYEEALEIFCSVPSSALTNEQRTRQIGATHLYLGLLSDAEGRMEDALQSFARARQFQQALADEEPENLDFRRNLANNLSCRANVYLELHRLDDARNALLEARQIQEELVRADAKHVGFRQQLAYTHDSLGRLAALEKDWRKALMLFEKARAVREEVANKKPEMVFWRRDLGRTDLHLAETYQALDQPGRAAEAAGRAVATFTKLVQENGEVVDCQTGLADALLRRGQLFQAAGKGDDAARDWEQARTIADELTRKVPTYIQPQRVKREVENLAQVATMAGGDLRRRK
jgi:tetratricopeptide (TPR) repeat protein